MNWPTYSILSHLPLVENKAALRELRLMGLSSIELALGAIPSDLSASGQREFRHILSSHELALNAIHVALSGKAFMPGGDIDRALDRTQSAMTHARELGAQSVVVDLGPLPRERPGPPRPVIKPEQLGLLILPDPPKVELAPQADAPVDLAAMSHFDSAMVELGRRADRLSVVIVLRSTLSPVSSLADAIRRVDCPWFFACCEPANLLAQGTDFTDAFNLIGPRVRHVLAHDVVLGEAGRTKPALLGRGDVPWRQLIELLRDADYSGPLTIDPTELPDRALATRTAIAQLRAYTS